MTDRSIRVCLVLLIIGIGAYLVFIHEQQMSAERAELRRELEQMRRDIALQRNPPSPKAERVQSSPKENAAITPLPEQMPLQKIEAPAVMEPPTAVSSNDSEKASPAQTSTSSQPKPEPQPKREERADDVDPNAGQIAKRREEEREDARAAREARQSQISANKIFYDALQRKETAQRAMIAWKNKLAGAIKDRDRAIADQTAAGQAGVSVARSGSTLVSVDTRGNLQEAIQRREAAEKAIAEAQNGLAQASSDFADASRTLDSAQVAKENADRKVQARVPPKQQPKFSATYTLKDGRILTAISVIATEDEYWIKTQDGIEAVKKDDVTEILK